jgi:putative endonuclease
MFVYIVRCADGRLYVGHTVDLAERERVHNDGRGATFTAGRRPVTLVYAEEWRSSAAAIDRERQIKRWTAEKKEALVLSDLRTLRVLARRRATPRGDNPNL